MSAPVPPAGGGTESTMPIRLPVQAPAPAAPPLPLPRRQGQAHLEPQLREPGGAGSGTPFGAFEDPTPADRAEATSPDQPAVGERAAT
ncbi:MAG: hypothetical protein NTW05_29180, partial [Pseudonocardiales bacterium]|nr:hypothetical protein [Pseudonocardiales bacterium]